MEITGERERELRFSNTCLTKENEAISRTARLSESEFTANQCAGYSCDNMILSKDLRLEMFL
jgi:hypothetical protein